MKKITVVLVDRANYGRLKPVLEIMRDDDEIDLSIICTGTMLLDRFGKAINLIREDGFEVFDEVYIELEGSVPNTMAKSIGFAIIELTNSLRRASPDFVLIIGDRSEALGAAIATVYQNYCLIHVQGGEITGSIDESARHAITKLAHYHFPSTEKSAKNIIKMGESERHVFNFGCPSVDVVNNSKDNIYSNSIFKGVGVNIDWSKQYILVLFHPVTTEHKSSEEQMNEVLKSVKSINMQTVLIWPNIDAGSDGISQAIRIFRESNSFLKMHVYKNFEPDSYIPLLKNASCAVGNSSSFIRDASFLGTPIVLIGSRQNGRESCDSVINVAPINSKITNAVRRQLSHGPYEPSYLYGSVGASYKIVEKIKKLKKYSQKKLSYV